MDEKSESNSVVVLEDGAEWPKWVAEYQRHATNSVVVAYAPGEALDEFVARVGRRLSELTGELSVAIVACAPRIGAEHLAGRERICRKLLAAMAPQKPGEVLLAAGVDACEASKHAIFELAGDLCDGLHGSSQVVRVRFSSGRPESGIMPSMPTPEIEQHPVYRAISQRRA
jgi:hypothetical protein